MPTANHPLRQYASVQTMRPSEYSHLTGSRDVLLKGTVDAQGHIEHTHFPDQSSSQNRFLIPTRKSSRPTTPNTDLMAAATRKDSSIAIPPLPDLHHRLRQARQDRRHFLFGNGEDNDTGDGRLRAPSPNRLAARQPEEQRSRTASPQSSHVHSSEETQGTQATSISLGPLQNESMLDSHDRMLPLEGENVGSFDLVAPPEEAPSAFSLEVRSEQLFSSEHLKVIFSDATLLLRFTAYLSTHRPQSVPMLIYYLDALKALKAIKYANAIAEALSPIQGFDFTTDLAPPTTNFGLEDKADQAFEALVRDDLPAYITYMYIQIVSASISQRISGVLAPHLREASEGLAEVFCLTDPSRPDNPIVFASEEFARTTQYGMSYTIGRNCRFLQGPRTNRLSVGRLARAISQGREHCEVFLNYRRDGSPFMNLLMIAPLCDSRGKTRYNIGAQVDVSGLVKDCTDLESLRRLVTQETSRLDWTHSGNLDNSHEKGDEFRELSEMLNMGELDTVRKCGGRMHREQQEDETESSQSSNLHRPRIVLEEPSSIADHANAPGPGGNGRLSGIYQNYLLIRPYPSLRILFASPTLRVPGILQSPFMNKIGGSGRVRDELTAALAEGRGVTAKVRWVSKIDEEGRSRWLHCTPLLGSNGQIGVWMIVLIDDDDGTLHRRWKQAPPVAPFRAGQSHGSSRFGRNRVSGSDDYESLHAGSLRNGHQTNASNMYQPANHGGSGSIRSSSPNSVRIY